VGQLAESSAVNSPIGRCEWNSDWFVFDALKFALSMLFDLNELRPKESALQKYVTNPNTPKNWREILATPEELGRHVFWYLWDDLVSMPPVSMREGKAGRPAASDADIANLSQMTFDFHRARRSLKINRVKEGKP
jgi:hypothetical protein